MRENGSSQEDRFDVTWQSTKALRTTEVLTKKTQYTKLSLEKMLTKIGDISGFLIVHRFKYFND